MICQLWSLIHYPNTSTIFGEKCGETAVCSQSLHLALYSEVTPVRFMIPCRVLRKNQVWPYARKEPMPICNIALTYTNIFYCELFCSMKILHFGIWHMIWFCMSEKFFESWLKSKYVRREANSVIKWLILRRILIKNNC